MTARLSFIGAIFACLLAAVAPSAAAPAAWHVPSLQDVVQTPVTFQNKGVRLSGTLYLPRTGGAALPAIVVVHGAEAPTRDYGLYRHLEQDLPRIGMAVLVFDRRGSGASQGNIDDTDYELLADDAIAGAKAIAQNPRVDPKRIGFWGLSQGGWLATLAASRWPDAAFAVSISGPLATPAEQMSYAASNMLALQGYPQADIAQAVATRHAVEDYLRGKVSAQKAQAVLDAAKTKPWFKDLFMDRAVNRHPEQSRWRKEMDYDSISPLSRLTVPVLLLYGSDDPWVPVALSVQRARALQATHPNIALHVVANANHDMAYAAKETMAFDKAAVKAGHPDAPAYFLVLGQWLTVHAGARAPN